MKFYHRSQADKFDGINRSFFNAEHGRVKLAIDRLQDLKEESPDDAHIFYAEGLIRKDYLGQGVKAGQLFQKAYELDNTHAFAANNATIFARNEQEFRKWASILVSLPSQDQSVQKAVNSILAELDNGIPYWVILYNDSQAYSKMGELGDSAAHAELVLLTSQMNPDEEVKVRRVRAQNIRSLDAKEEAYRNTIMEAFPPEDRLALHEALAELERALALDEYDPELWNLKAAWLCYLGHYAEAISCADRAIGLRPLHYAKPYINKANALWTMGKEQAAIASAQEALKQAGSGDSIEELERAREIIKDFSVKRQDPTLIDMEPIIGQIVKAVTVTVDLEMGQSYDTTDKLVEGVLRRSHYFQNTMDYVPMMAELLSGVTPETASFVVLRTAEENQTVYDYCLYATLYVAVHSEGVQQRDAARFLVLSLLWAMNGLAIRKTYREVILATSAVARDEMSRLDQIIHKELGRMNPFFPQLIAEQEPVSEIERERADRRILSRFRGMS